MRDVKSLKVPTLTRESKYNYSDEAIQDAIEKLRAGDEKDMPGDGPFEKEGQVRAASNRLTLLVRESSELNPGVRSWEAEDGWWFVLRPTRRNRTPKSEAKVEKKGTAKK
jgi:hypothetical protein